MIHFLGQASKYNGRNAINPNAKDCWLKCAMNCTDREFKTSSGRKYYHLRFDHIIFMRKPFCCFFFSKVNFYEMLTTHRKRKPTKGSRKTKRQSMAACTFQHKLLSSFWSIFVHNLIYPTNYIFCWFISCSYRYWLALVVCISLHLNFLLVWIVFFFFCFSIWLEMSDLCREMKSAAQQRA